MFSQKIARDLTSSPNNDSKVIPLRASRSNALDRLYFSVPTDDERVSRRIGYVLLGVTAILAVVAFWPWLFA